VGAGFHDTDIFGNQNLVGIQGIKSITEIHLFCDSSWKQAILVGAPLGSNKENKTKSFAPWMGLFVSGPDFTPNRVTYIQLSFTSHVSK